MSVDVAPSTAPVVPRVIKPNFKATQGKTSYTVALDNMIAEFSKAYINDEMSPEQKDQMLSDLTDTTTNIRDLCDRYLRPLCETSQTGGAVAATTASPNQTSTTSKPLSDWQIFLKYAKELVPGSAESTDKMNLWKTYYAGTGTDERVELRNRYCQENPNATTSTMKDTNQVNTTAKSKRQTGFTMFAKDWYAAFKAANPDASGLQSKLCSQAWKDLPESDREQWKTLAKQQ